MVQQITFENIDGKLKCTGYSEEVFEDIPNDRLNELQRYFKFMTAETYEERNEIAAGDKILMKLNDWIKNYLSDEENVKRILEHEKFLSSPEGIRQTREKHAEYAKYLLSNNVDVSLVSDITGFTTEELEELK